jgi:Ca-activated chloride channel homolog
MNFAYPSVLWLLALLPLLSWLKGKAGPAAAIRFPALTLTLGLHRLKRSAAGKTSALLRFLALGLIILALARPQVKISGGHDTLSGIDIMLAVDVSSSMLALDMSSKKKPLTRLDIVRTVLADFIKKRPNDRLGLIAFAGNPYLVSPLTLNHEWLESNLDRLQAGLIEDGTAIGSALAMSTNRLRDVPGKSKIVILLSDGENNAGSISPILAAQAANSFDIKVYTIAIGGGGIVQSYYLDPITKKIARNRKGEPLVTQAALPVDIETLAEIANITHADAFRAKDKAALQTIYDTIDKLERTDAVLNAPQNVKECAVWFIAAAFFLLLAEYLLSIFIWRRWP